ncbi:MAG: hypothetical protein ACXWDA_06380, partial [Aeromicrobium sp.]
AILGSALIGAAATSGRLRWAFVIPLALMPLVLVVAKSFRTADSAKGLVRSGPRFHELAELEK